MDSESFRSVLRCITKERARLFPKQLQVAFKEIVRLRSLLDNNPLVRLSGVFGAKEVAEIQTDADLKVIVRAMNIEEAMRIFFAIGGLRQYLNDSDRNDPDFRERAEDIHANPTALNVVRHAISVQCDENWSS